MSELFGNSSRAIRWEKKRLRLGDPKPKCAKCGNSEIACLRRQKSTRKGNSADGIICDNCHKKCRGSSSQTEHKKRLKIRNAGYSTVECAVCCESDIRTLELHHISGEANSSFVAPLCGNCHAAASDAQEDLPTDLRLRDPDRRPLVLQAAFEFGLAIVLGFIATQYEDASGKAFLALVAVILVAWACWNVAADHHFATQFGPDYSTGVPARVPS